jgi:hypothetical protein
MLFPSGTLSIGWCGHALEGRSDCGDHLFPIDLRMDFGENDTNETFGSYTAISTKYTKGRCK